MPLRRPSIQPTQSASSTDSGQVMLGRPVATRWKPIHCSLTRPWFASNQARNSAAVAKKIGSSLFAIEVIERFAAEQPAFGRTNEPFLAVGVVTRFADRVVGHDDDDQIFLAIVDELMRLVRRKDESVAGHNHGVALG